MSSTAKQLIENYTNLLTKNYGNGKADSTLENLFSNAKNLKLAKKAFKNKGTVYLYLGTDNTSLYGIIVASDKTPTADTIDSLNPEIIKFSSTEFIIPKGLDGKFNSTNTIIAYDACVGRNNSWKTEKTNWLNKAVQEKNVVKYFTLKQENVSSKSDNNFIFGLVPTETSFKISNPLRIDLMTVNEAYMDYTCPVPPYTI